VDNSLTGLVVSYDERSLLEQSLSSIRRYYPDLLIIIVDGSPDNSECRKFVNGLGRNYIKELFDYNISHGNGLHHGIMISPDDYVLCFDSDIIMNRPCIEQMLELMDEETWGIGKTIPYSQNTYNIELERKGDLTYMYPYFHIINRKVYLQYEPYVHSAGPGQLVFIDLFIKGKESLLKHFPVDEYVTHKGGGTSNRKTPRHREDWILQDVYYWRKGFNLKRPNGN
jgi:glycosyltransferase involved in cell wall biosynthesis